MPQALTIEVADDPREVGKRPAGLAQDTRQRGATVGFAGANGFFLGDGRLPDRNPAAAPVRARLEDHERRGLAFNIASYALLTCMIAQQTGLEPGEFVWTGGDVHIYDNHMDQVLKQLAREPYDYPQLKIARKPDSIFDYTLEDFEVVGYQHHPTIKAPIAV